MTAEEDRLELTRDALIAGLSSMRDALIAGLSSTAMRLRLLENRNLNFRDAYDQARAQELAFKNSDIFQGHATCNSTSISQKTNDDEREINSTDFCKASV